MLYFYIIKEYIVAVKKDYLNEPFELDLKEPIDACPRGEHGVSFFELVYIVSGTGTQNINGNKFSYKEGDLFLLMPDDVHYFRFKAKTQLFFIRFNRIFFSTNQLASSFLQQIEQRFFNANGFQGCIIDHKGDNLMIKHIMQSLLLEKDGMRIYEREVTHLLVHSVLVIVSRNLLQKTNLKVGEKTDDKAAHIIQYVHENIYHPEKLSADNISKVFGISVTYVGRYFKNQTGKAFTEYIAQYRMKLIENRLKYSDMRINEIADEFGFTDKSHLNRFFKKSNGMSPSLFRQNNN
ncbi:AraC family transcriptional regulator [Chryseobacterium paludis]|uniref:AraC family transcriptional regulator n=1 Tax=Chryseobacterium paludis TaxID=2956784 RepID=UPI0021C24E17|nr:AraC family transcriptional regulator [Chryseobacterium paludis]